MSDIPESEADRCVHDRLLHASGDQYEETYTIEDGHVTEHIETDTHRFNYDAHTGNLISIESKQ